MAAANLDNKQTRMAGAAKEKGEVEAAQANNPVVKLSTPESLVAPGAQAAIQAKIDDPTTSKDDRRRFSLLLPRAKMAQDNKAKIDEAQKRLDQTIQDGDAGAAADLLVSGLVAPSQLISSRRPEFAQQAFSQAVQKTGGKWSAAAADAQYKYASSPQTQNTLNLLSTMQAPGGSIDIAQKTFDTIPGKIDLNTFNKIVDGAITEFGGKSTVAFKAAMVSLADEYAQVLAGGAATNETLEQAKSLIQRAYTKQQGTAAFDTIRQDMMARQKGVVRGNPTLMNIYPAPPNVPPLSGKSVSLKAAMALPVNKGKTEDQVRADIAAHGHQVGE